MPTVIIIEFYDRDDDGIVVRRSDTQRGRDECVCPLATEINGGTGEDSSLLH